MSEPDNIPNPVEVKREYYPMTFYCDSFRQIIRPEPSPAPQIESEPEPESSLSTAKTSPISPKISKFTLLVLVGILVVLFLSWFNLIFLIGVLILAALVLPITVLKTQSESQEDRAIASEPVEPVPSQLIPQPLEKKPSLREQLSKTLLDRDSIYDFIIDKNNQAKKGASEAYFLTYLEKWFSSPWRIMEHCQFIKGDYAYTPDFILYLDDFNLGVDIEIDEPYAFSNSLPVHLKEDKKYINRDKFFLSLGFIVIRFAEYQIVKYPDYCCLHLARVLNQFLDINKVRAPIDNKLEPLPTSQWRVKSWTKRESEIMIKTKVRETYLKSIQS